MKALNSIKNQLKPSSFSKVMRNSFSDTMRDKEKAEEKFFFDKEESINWVLFIQLGKLAKNLLDKLKESTVEQEDSEDYISKERIKVGYIILI